MDATLPASFGSDFLTLRNVERFADGSSYRFDLELKSGAFSARYKFFVEPDLFEAFVVALNRAYSALSGEARLQPRYEPQYVLIKSASSGHMDVAGELIEHSEHNQRLKFAFRSDQSCVGLFLEQLRACVIAHASIYSA